MKNGTPRSNFHDTSANFKKESLEKLPTNTKLSFEAPNSAMTEQLVTPPPRVWDKIEKILDEQDDRRKNVDILIASSFGRNRMPRSKNFYLASVAGLSLVAGIVWILR